MIICVVSKLDRHKRDCYYWLVTILVADFHYKPTWCFINDGWMMMVDCLTFHNWGGQKGGHVLYYSGTGHPFGYASGPK